MIILQDSRTAKFDSEKTSSEMWGDQIMLITPQRFSAIFDIFNRGLVKTKCESLDQLRLT